jgi:hypothetical protein
MKTKTVFQTDQLGIYVGETIADLSPLEEGVWLIPAGCVEVAPPAVPEFKAALWTGQRWQLIDSYHGLTAYSTETREAVVVDRVGALPAGLTLEVPGPGQIWQNGHWVDDVPALIEIRFAAQVELVNATCSRQIVSGFWSQALGDPHFYPSELEDQLNLIGMVQRGLGGALSCRDEAGTKAFLDHSADQLRQVGDEFTTVKLQQLQRANDLKLALEKARAASDLDALNAVTWAQP